ncbi:tRNA uridine-5-carboxymethylaminomethyl(34) synthesis GTPase MnmE [Litoreibacter roseus]|uniref:tRNA uridine-5-carboxymethylaminomethyl(34) synthesis GTPase MnmE n=1 Tax=Litoreibacter roseus TaxID=2601869 RepID=UPI00135BC649|nr:tRNA uridine-5-carboxymethylaminomethyl(34) synthesis GTPase MnmE [Litoreibacter roseus]
MDTIYGLATARGKAGVAVIRVSGPAVGRICSDLLGRSPEARVPVLASLRDRDGVPVDRCLVLRFPEGHSFTGEEVVEFQLHGGTAIVERVLGLLSEIDGVRFAEPGEFTRRALENDRLSLTEVEGLADLIDAETEAQRRQAMRVFDGRLQDLVAGWRDYLVRAAALLQVTIDFADEDVPDDTSAEVGLLITKVLEEIDEQLAGIGISERIRSGFEVAILGPPNIGKSTLLNSLAGRDAAITSPHAGTTRDIIEVRMDLGGLPVTLLDTAGLRNASDDVEKIGIERARSRAAKADLRVFLTEDTQKFSSELLQEDDIVLTGKMDLGSKHENGVSGLTGDGVGNLVRRIENILQNRSTGASLATRRRHREALTDAAVSLRQCIILLNSESQIVELVFEELRSALHALECMIGRVDVEAVLDEVFAGFCLGK